jgi:D-alanyl-lipoteichoic acid acyltransferase DltB (MBOAT superfamily)
LAEKPLLFNSAEFLCFFIAFLSLFLLLKKQRFLRNLWTVAFSLFFYYKCSGFYFLILLFSTITDYYLGFAIYKVSKKSVKRAYLILSLVSNLGILAYFKYSNFIVNSLNDLGCDLQTINIFLPIGISFFTFQTLSYSIDIYRGNLKPEKSILNFAFFVTFFPQLVAGPIVRAKEFLPQLRQKLHLSNSGFGKAVFLIGNGLFKKAVISDYISSNFVDRIFENPNLYSGFENLLGVYGYSLQIYCDFSGYSDLAIGIALLLGFNLPDNFNYPYKSSSITEFWRRWHISLSSWLKDYLYISLGGNRKGRVRTYINLMITMFLGGLWHGANWKFVFWGALHGLMLVIEKLIKPYVRLPKNKITKVVGVLFTFHFVSFCWIFFRAKTYINAFEIITQIFNNFDVRLIHQVFDSYTGIVLLIIVGFVLHFKSIKIDKVYSHLLTRAPVFIKALYLAFICWLFVQLSSSEVIPFIYFQF